MLFSYGVSLGETAERTASSILATASSLLKPLSRSSERQVWKSIASLNEYTFVLEGVVGVQVGEEVLLARPGDLVFKPKGVPHAFWNPADESARALEIISPAGFERYFAELAPLFPPANKGPLDEEPVNAVREKYGLEMDMGSIPVLAERHGLLVDAPPPSRK